MGFALVSITNHNQAVLEWIQVDSRKGRLAMKNRLSIPTDWGHELGVQYSTKGPGFQFIYVKGNNYPPGAAVISWQQWDRLVAWVDLQRKEEALKNVQ